MSEKIVQLNEKFIKGQIRELVRGSMEEALNELLEKEAESLTQSAECQPAGHTPKTSGMREYSEFPDTFAAETECRTDAG